MGRKITRFPLKSRGSSLKIVIEVVLTVVAVVVYSNLRSPQKELAYDLGSPPSRAKSSLRTDSWDLMGPPMLKAIAAALSGCWTGWAVTAWTKRPCGK